jgi:hypothetical protein
MTAIRDGPHAMRSGHWNHTPITLACSGRRKSPRRSDVSGVGFTNRIVSFYSRAGRAVFLGLKAIRWLSRHRRR